jgi:transposase InsO family protein
MPWDRVVERRLKLVLAAEADAEPFVVLCEREGISRKTGYKWWGRYRADGPMGLLDRSSAPKQHGRAAPEELAEKIILLRQARPSWGPRKVIARLRLDHPDLAWPAASTAGEILKRAGLVTSRRVRRRAPPRLGDLTVPERPNQVWAADYKGWIRLGDGSRCEPLTITDGFCRYLLRLSCGSGTTEAEGRPIFEAAFEEYGLPEVIRSDNGPPFASTGVTGLTALSVWWIKLGIRPERIDPGRPQQNGRHERFHLTLLEAMRPPEPNRAAQAARFEAFRRDYNHERPHQALSQLPPATFYDPSPRKLPARPDEPNYPAEAAVRSVRSNGDIKWRGQLVHISSALAGETVAVEEDDDGDWCVRFYDHPLGIIDRKQNRLRRLSGAACQPQDL